MRFGGKKRLSIVKRTHRFKKNLFETQNALKPDLETGLEKIRQAGRRRLLFPEEVCIPLGVDRQQLGKLT